jgi:hypothetical protein
MAQTDHSVFALDQPLAQQAQGFALEKVFHWRSMDTMLVKL